ncbi:MAG: hypothetical protein M1818_002395, partial [Claussenomyces sp. TS43310]
MTKEDLPLTRKTDKPQITSSRRAVEAVLYPDLAPQQLCQASELLAGHNRSAAAVDRGDALHTANCSLSARKRVGYFQDLNLNPKAHKKLARHLPLNTNPGIVSHGRFLSSGGDEDQIR